MSAHETNAGRLREGTITYTPNEFGSGSLGIDVPLHAPAPREHLIAAATKVRPNASFGTIGFTVDQVAAGHLREATGVTAFIENGGQQIHSQAHVPRPPQHLPSFNETSTPKYGEPRPLTAEQENLLPHLARIVPGLVPPELDAHVKDIAHLAAQEILTTNDVLRAYQRTSITEVLRHYDGPKTPKALSPELEKGRRTTHLSFPEHASGALREPNHTTPAATAKISVTPAARISYER